MIEETFLIVESDRKLDATLRAANVKLSQLGNDYQAYRIEHRKEVMKIFGCIEQPQRRAHLYILIYLDGPDAGRGLIFFD
jgi:hypothetical protein